MKNHDQFLRHAMLNACLYFPAHVHFPFTRHFFFFQKCPTYLKTTPGGPTLGSTQKTPVKLYSWPPKLNSKSERKRERGRG
jgi:hypothetical protein